MLRHVTWLLMVCNVHLFPVSNLVISKLFWKSVCAHGVCACEFGVNVNGKLGGMGFAKIQIV